MKKTGNREFLFEVFSLIVIAIAVQAVYATVVRPRADAAQAYDKAQMQKDPNYVSERNVYIIVKDYEQEVCFMLALWACAIMGYKGYTLRRGRELLQTDLLRLPEGMKILPEDSRDYARQVETLPADLRSELLPRALLSGLHRFGSTRNIQDVSSAIHDTCELEFGRLDAELSMVRYVAWAIPAIGFIGTVRGIGESLQQAHKAVEGDVSGVVAGLGICFQFDARRAGVSASCHVPAAPDPAAPGTSRARHGGIPRRARRAPDAGALIARRRCARPPSSQSSSTTPASRSHAPPRRATEPFGEPSPGFAVLHDGRVLLGRDAALRHRVAPLYAQNRYWHALSVEPLPWRARGVATAADLAHAHLSALLAPAVRRRGHRGAARGAAGVFARAARVAGRRSSTNAA